MTLAISIIAILISLASLAFNFHQYKNSKSLKHLEKCNDVLRQAYKLLRASWELRDKFDSADDIDVDGFSDSLDMLEKSIEGQISSLIETGNLETSDVYRLEGHLLHLDVELDLLVKQLDTSIDFKKSLIRRAQ